MHADQSRYVRFTGPARVEKAANTLSGLLTGLAADSVINTLEISHLRQWLHEHRDLRLRHPLSELFGAVESALEDGVLTSEEKQDLVWLCDRLKRSNYYPKVTSDMQFLHGMLAGVSADSVLCADELQQLSEWIDDHRHLQTMWPYDEVESLLTKVLADKRIDAEEHAELMHHFTQYGHRADDRTLDTFGVAGQPAIQVGGLCAVCPDIQFLERNFCLTGASSRFSRTEFADRISAVGGTVKTNVTADLHYLVVGADGNPCWAYSCYGRKVEKAIDFRRRGSSLVIVHENDIHDALEEM